MAPDVIKEPLMKRGLQGKWVTRTEVEAHQAFVPNALPPIPPLDLAAFAALTERANRALGRLDGVSTMLPDTRLFLYFYVRKEAVLSSQIEGTQSSLSDLLLYETTELPGVPLEDVQEVSRYVDATERAMKLLRGGLPLSSRFIRQIHEVLLNSGRGASKQPGAFRKQPVWLGGSSPSAALFVPPPWSEVDRCIGQLETYLHDETAPTLIKAALVHAQFETIHPFPDGNGRLGRLLIALILVAEQALSEPLLYLSLYFRQHRQQYYELLQGTREAGDWEAWIEFFLHGVELTAENAHTTARKALALFAKHEQQIREIDGPSKLSVMAVYQQLRQRPIVDAKTLTAGAGVTPPTTLKALERLTQLGLVQEISGRQSRRIFAYRPLLELLQNDLPL